MALNNSILFSAAYAAYLSSTTGADVSESATNLAQALAFATAVDTAILADGAISAAGAQTAAAYTTGGASAKVGLATAICRGALNGANPTGLPPASYTALATKIATAYAAAVAVQTIP